jgi:hypothetical protein
MEDFAYEAGEVFERLTRLERGLHDAIRRLKDVERSKRSSHGDVEDDLIGSLSARVAASEETATLAAATMERRVRELETGLARRLDRLATRVTPKSRTREGGRQTEGSLDEAVSALRAEIETIRSGRGADRQPQQERSSG